MSVNFLNFQTAPAATAPRLERNSLSGRISSFVKNIFESIKNAFGYIGAKVSAFFAPLTNRISYLFSKSPADKTGGDQTPVTNNTVEEKRASSNTIPLNTPRPVINPQSLSSTTEVNGAKSTRIDPVAAMKTVTETATKAYAVFREKYSLLTFETKVTVACAIVLTGYTYVHYVRPA